MELANRLQPVLKVSQSHLRTVARLEAGLAPRDAAAARGSARALGITDRERAILDLMNTGLTTTSIAHKLFISPRTVYKHQENLYRKLGVGDRLAALRAANNHLLLPGENHGPTSLRAPA